MPISRSLDVNSSKGFTLIELLVVVSIIAILALIAYGTYNTVQVSARDGKRKGDLNAIQQALEQYKAAKGNYPCFGSPCPSPGSYGWANVANLTVLESNYIQKIPTDPKNGTGCPGYLIVTDGVLYTLFIKLENTNDSSAQAVKAQPSFLGVGSSSDGYKSFTISGSTCGGSIYNYWVNSLQ